MGRIEQFFTQNKEDFLFSATNAICGMSMHDPLREVPSDLFGQRREAATGGKNSFCCFLADKNRSAASYSIN